MSGQRAEQARGKCSRSVGLYDEARVDGVQSLVRPAALPQRGAPPESASVCAARAAPRTRSARAARAHQLLPRPLPGLSPLQPLQALRSHRSRVTLVCGAAYSGRLLQGLLGAAPVLPRRSRAGHAQCAVRAVHLTQQTGRVFAAEVAASSIKCRFFEGCFRGVRNACPGTKQMRGWGGKVLGERGPPNDARTRKNARGAPPSPALAPAAHAPPRGCDFRNAPLPPPSFPP
ncbi:MAG: hypothetical protein J3K34DRAFT_67148 [Monoraphidium minutum]|nr:MAG: hypothetical protein J3K34DRAFT_67148 [Monoraphidium minutum]